jgi:hypothetical protein
MTDELKVIDSDKNFTFDLLVNAQKEARKLNVPSIEAVEDLCKTAMRMLAADLENNDFAGATDILNKVGAFEKYLRSIPKTHANYTLNVNTMAATHVRGLRDTGRKLKNHMAPESWQPNSSVKSLEEPMIHESDLEKYNITRNKYGFWRRLSDIPDDKFDSYIAPYIDGGVEKGMILYWTNLYNHFYSTPSTPDELPIAMTPAMAKIYRAVRDLYAAIDGGVEDIAKGETPITQPRYILEYWKKLPEKMAHFKSTTKELY